MNFSLLRSTEAENESPHEGIQKQFSRFCPPLSLKTNDKNLLCFLD